jgi:hypothetical protein
MRVRRQYRVREEPVVIVRVRCDVCFGTGARHHRRSIGGGRDYRFKMTRIRPYTHCRACCGTGFKL